LKKPNGKNPGGQKGDVRKLGFSGKRTGHKVKSTAMKKKKESERGTPGTETGRGGGEYEPDAQGGGGREERILLSVNPETILLGAS